MKYVGEETAEMTGWLELVAVRGLSEEGSSHKTVVKTKTENEI